MEWGLLQAGSSLGLGEKEGALAGPAWRVFGLMAGGGLELRFGGSHG